MQNLYAIAYFYFICTTLSYVLARDPEEIHLKDVHTILNSEPLQLPKRSLHDEVISSKESMHFNY
ncbi:DNA-binding IscR family transcriptional regulator [Paenibacillus sp. W2I17]|nr:DNA-binding IscR family transcriptional regulator [Paenibacillus sp. W2I17]